MRTYKAAIRVKNYFNVCFDVLNNFLLKFIFGALADVNFCLRLREAGLSVVYNPTASFRRLGKSQPKIIDPTIATKFRDAHPTIFAQGDPFYNPNLSLDHTDCRLMV